MTSYRYKEKKLEKKRRKQLLRKMRKSRKSLIIRAISSVKGRLLNRNLPIMARERIIEVNKELKIEWESKHICVNKKYKTEEMVEIERQRKVEIILERAKQLKQREEKEIIVDFDIDNIETYNKRKEGDILKEIDTEIERIEKQNIDVIEEKESNTEIDEQKNKKKLSKEDIIIEVGRINKKFQKKILKKIRRIKKKSRYYLTDACIDLEKLIQENLLNKYRELAKQKERRVDLEKVKELVETTIKEKSKDVEKIDFRINQPKILDFLDNTKKKTEKPKSVNVKLEDTKEKSIILPISNGEGKIDEGKIEERIMNVEVKGVEKGNRDIDKPKIEKTKSVNVKLKDRIAEKQEIYDNQEDKEEKKLQSSQEKKDQNRKLSEIQEKERISFISSYLDKRIFSKNRKDATIQLNQKYKEIKNEFPKPLFREYEIIGYLKELIKERKNKPKKENIFETEKKFQLFAFDVNNILISFKKKFGSLKPKKVIAPLEKIFKDFLNGNSHHAYFFASKHLEKYLSDIPKKPNYHIFIEELIKDKSTWEYVDVDISLAIEIGGLIEKYKEQISELYLGSGDKDFHFLIEKAIRYKIKVHLIIVDYFNASAELMNLIDESNIHILYS